MKFSPSLKRRLLASVEKCRAAGKLLRGFMPPSSQIEVLARVHPGKKVIVLPVKHEFKVDWNGKPVVKVIPERACLARPCFVLNEKATATLTVETVGFDGVTSTEWPSWSMSSGTWHNDQLEVYWRSKGVTRNTPHRKITGLVSPGDGWLLKRAAVGDVFRDGYNRIFAITKQGRKRTELLRIDGEVDCMYRGINLVKVTVTKPTSPARGALEFMGIMGAERVAEIILLADTGQTYGSGHQHAA